MFGPRKLSPIEATNLFPTCCCWQQPVGQKAKCHFLHCSLLRQWAALAFVDLAAVVGCLDGTTMGGRAMAAVRQFQAKSGIV